MSAHFHDPDHAPRSPLFEAWGRFILRFRFALLALTLAATGLMGHQVATKIRIDTSIEAFLATRSEAFETLEDMRDDFGRDEMFLVIVEGDVFSMQFLEKLKKLHAELAAINIPIETLGQRKRDRDAERDAVAQPTEPKPAVDDGFGDFGDDEGWGDEEGGTIVDQITSLINVRQTTWNEGLEVSGLLDDWPSEDELPALREHVLSQPTLVGQVVGKAGRHAVIAIRTAFMSEADSALVDVEIHRIVARHETAGFRADVAGMPAMAAAINELMLGDMKKMAIAAVALLFLSMAFVFRHPIGVIGPSFVVIQAVVWTFGGMAFLGIPMTMITNILPAFILCVGIGDSVHILSVYRDARGSGADNDEAVVHALGTTGLPVLFTTLTTAVGLLSFRFAAVDAIQHMGTFAAYGVLVALLHSLVFLPIVLSFNRSSLLGLSNKARRGAADWLDRFLSFCNGLSRPTVVDGAVSQRRRTRTLAGAALVAAVSVFGASMLYVYHNPLAWIPPGFEIRDAFDSMDDNLGGTADLIMMFEAKPGKNLRDREALLAMKRLEDHIRAYEHPQVKNLVGNTVSILDVVRESSRATHEMDQKFYTLPDTQRGVADMLTLFENASPDDLRRLATIDLQRTVMTIRVKWLDASSYGPLVQYIRGGIDEHVGDLVTVYPTGSVLNLLTVVGGLLRDLMRSFGMAFIVITLMMIALLRDVKLGFIAMVPNLLPIAMIMGIMGLSGIPIDLNNIMIGSIAIGIAVDDTIHFLHQFRAHLHRHESVEEAIQHSFNHAGRAMVTTSIILVSGFCVFLAADMYNIQRFGMLVALTLILALLVDLMVAPALLRLAYTSRATDDKTGEENHEHAQAAAQ